MADNLLSSIGFGPGVEKQPINSGTRFVAPEEILNPGVDIVRSDTGAQTAQTSGGTAIDPVKKVAVPKKMNVAEEGVGNVAKKTATGAAAGGIPGAIAGAALGIAQTVIAAEQNKKARAHASEENRLAAKRQKELQRLQQMHQARRDQVGIAKSQGQQTQDSVSLLMNAFAQSLR